MSDLSIAEQSFGLLPATMVPPLSEEMALYQDVPVSTDLQPYEVGFRRLRGPREIGRILHLRDEIQLTTARGDASFETREKKETKSGLWARSCALANT
jgi:hypothetical protein